MVNLTFEKYNKLVKESSACQPNRSVFIKFVHIFVYKVKWDKCDIET